MGYLQQFGRFQRNARLFLVSTALSGVSAGIAAVLYNLYLASLGYREDFVGATLFIGTIGAALAIFPAGLLIDRWSGKWVLIGSSALVGLGGVGAILARQPAALLAFAFMTGAAAAFTLVVYAPFLTRNSTPEDRPHLFSLNIFLGLMTTVLGEVVGGALPTWLLHNPRWLTLLAFWFDGALASQSEPRAYQLALLFSGVLSLPSFIPLFLMSDDLPTPAAELAASGPEKRGLPWQEWLSKARHYLQPVYLRAFVRTPFFYIVLVQILTGMGAGLLVPYFNLFFVRHLHANSALFGLLDGTANGLNALTSLCAPWLARRLGRINSIALTRLCSLPLLLSIGFTSSLTVAAVLYPLRQGTMDMSQGILQVFSMEVVTEQHRGLANSTYQATSQAAWAITSSLGGLIIVRFGYSPLFVVTGMCYLAAIVLLWGRFRKSEAS